MLAAPYPCIEATLSIAAPGHASCDSPTLVLTNRPTWTRGVTFWETPLVDIDLALASPNVETGVHVRSRFQSVDDPCRHAVYSLQESERARGALDVGGHTLAVVREFRRVPLEASAMRLTLFTARPGSIAAVVGALAHFAERAVSLWQPTYLLLARSLERPRLAILLTAVDESAALAAASPAAFSLDPLLPELDPLLAEEPEVYVYRPAPLIARDAALVSPRAV